MTTVPGTYFTIGQLEAALEDDNVSDERSYGSGRMNAIAYAYRTEKRQYEKALAWYLLSAKESNIFAPVRIGTLYFHGNGVPKNYLCALKWYLNAPRLNEIPYSLNEIGELFENGFGVPLDKYKALEWYIRLGDDAHIYRLKDQGYSQSAADKRKSFYQLKKETEAILDAEKKKLEAKQDKTQQEIETLVDLNITYKLTGGDQNAWTDVPVLLANDKERYTKAVNSSVTNNQNDMLELKNQNQLLTQHINTFESQGIKPLSVNQELKLKINSLEHQVKEKDGKTTSVLTDNQLLNQEKDSKINSLENKNRTHHASSLSQMQMLETLNHEKTTFEQNKIQSVIEMEQLKASNASLEHLVKSKEDTIISLNGENKHLSTTNQLVTEMMETQKALLQAKTNEMELLRQSMERQLADEKKRVEVLEQEIRAPKQEMVQDQTHVQNTRRLNNDIINPANVESSLWW